MVDRATARRRLVIKPNGDREWWLTPTLDNAPGTPPPPPPPPPPPDGTPDWTTWDAFVQTNESMQAAFNANPGGKIVLAAGVHSASVTNLTPTNGQHIVGEPGAIIDGQEANAVWLNMGAADVLVENVEVRNFHFTPDPGHWDGPINGRNTHRWSVRYCHLHDNSGGVTMGSGALVEHCLIEDNWWEGVVSRGAVGFDPDPIASSEQGFLRNNRIRGNGFEAINLDKEDHGAMKIAIYYRGFDCINNWVHNNSNGIWYDIDNGALVPCIIRSNLVHDNGTNAALFYEISFDAIIEWNILKHAGGNGVIYNSTSKNVTYRENAIEDVGGAGIINMRHADGRAGPSSVPGLDRSGENLSFYDNDCRSNSWTGYRFNDVIAPGEIDRNTYRTNGLDYYALPALNPGTFAQWQGAGFDGNGQQLAHGSGEPELPAGAVAFEEVHYGVWGLD